MANQARPTAKRWSPHPHAVVGLLALTSILAYADRIVLAVAAPLIMQELHLSAAEIGIAGAAFTVAYGLMSVPGGIAADRYSARLTLALGVLIWSISTAATGLIGSLAGLILFRIGLGLGEGVLAPANVRIVANWFKPSQRARANSIWLSGMQFGMVIGAPLSAWIIAIAGWRAVFYVLGGAGIIVSVILLLGLRNAPPISTGAEPATEHNTPSEPPVPAAPALPLFNRRLALLCLGYFCVVMLWTANSSWLPYYLVKDRGISILNAGFLSSLPYFAGAMAILFGGWLSDKILKGRRALPSALASLLAPAFVAVSLTTPDDMVCIISFAFANGFAGLALSLYWTIPSQILAHDRLATSTGIMLAIGTTGASMVPLAMGYVADRTGSFYWSFIGVCAITALGALFTFLLHGVETKARRAEAGV